MTTQELYKKLNAGEITEQKFLYEVRRDQNLHFISKFNNFKDTVRILKNKGIISEEKQEVEVYAKTIDMVNPYEYARGMDYELGVVIDSVGNRVMDGNSGDSAHDENITYEDILKAQKKVLKNLTKNPYYYQQKLIPQMEGESEYEVEVNAKSIEALKKKAGKIIREGKDTITYDPKIHDDVIENLFMYEKDEYKVIKPGMIKFMDPDEAYNAANDLRDLDTPVKLAEHGEDYEKVSKVMGNVSPLEEDDKTQAFVMALDMWKNAKGTSDAQKALDNLKKVSKDSLGVELPLDEQQLSMFDDEESTKKFDDLSNIDFEKEDYQRLSFAQRSDLVQAGLSKIRGARNQTEKRKAAEDFVKLSNAMGIPIELKNLLEADTDYDRAKDAKRLGKKGEENIYGAGVKKGEEIAAKKMAAKREAIYEKYAEQYNVDVNEIKDRLEAYKLEKEAIEVEDEDTAIAVQKKSPEADVRIVNK